MKGDHCKTTPVPSDESHGQRTCRRSDTVAGLSVLSPDIPHFAAGSRRRAVGRELLPEDPPQEGRWRRAVAAALPPDSRGSAAGLLCQRAPIRGQTPEGTSPTGRRGSAAVEQPTFRRSKARGQRTTAGELPRPNGGRRRASAEKTRRRRGRRRRTAEGAVFRAPFICGATALWRSLESCCAAAGCRQRPRPHPPDVPGLNAELTDRSFVPPKPSHTRCNRAPSKPPAPQPRLPRPPPPFVGGNAPRTSGDAADGGEAATPTVSSPSPPPTSPALHLSPSLPRDGRRRDVAPRGEREDGVGRPRGASVGRSASLVPRRQRKRRDSRVACRLTHLVRTLRLCDLGRRRGSRVEGQGVLFRVSPDARRPTPDALVHHATQLRLTDSNCTSGLKF